MTYANPNQYSLTARQTPPIESAERHAASALNAGRTLARKVRGPVDDLFGHVVAEALLPDIDNLHESAVEAFYHFRAANDERQERLVATQRDLATVLGLLRVAAEETAARFARARKAPPEWVGQALAATRGPQAQEPF